MWMLIRSIIVVVIGLVIIILAMSYSHAATCYASADEVRHHSPQSWPTWTTRAHEGKCWFAGDRNMVHHEAARKPMQHMASIPLPRPRCDRGCRTVKFYRDVMGWSDDMLADIWPELVHR